MGAVTRRFPEIIESIITECYIYSGTDLSQAKTIKRVKISKALWDTGATGSLISSRVVKSLGLSSIGKSGVSGYNNSMDVKETYLVHIGMPTGDVVTNILAMECADNDDYDVILGMDVICNGDFAISNLAGKTTFSFRIPSQQEIVFN